MKKIIGYMIFGILGFVIIYTMGYGLAIKLEVSILLGFICALGILGISLLITYLIELAIEWTL